MMNKRIKSQNIEDLLFFDIETVSKNKELDVDGEEYNLFAWKHRDKNTDRFKINTELELLYKTKAALSPVFNKIVCISVATVKGGIVYYKAITGSEKEIIEEFYTILNSQNWIPCGYNIIGFDMPTVRLKAYQVGAEVELKDSLTDSQKKPWDMTKNFIDLMEVFKGTMFYNLSLEEVCYLSNIESPKSAIKGHEVTRTYYREENGIKVISEYCNRDTVACVMVFAKLQGIDLNTFQYVDRADKPKGEIVEDTRTVLEKLYDAKELTEPIRKELEETLKKKKPTKKDKKILTDIVHSMSIDSNFMGGDKQEDIDRKQKEVIELIEKI